MRGFQPNKIDTNCSLLLRCECFLSPFERLWILVEENGFRRQKIIRYRSKVQTTKSIFVIIVNFFLKKKFTVIHYNQKYSIIFGIDIFQDKPL